MTRDDFLDAMGEIDEQLIDSVLDVPRVDTIYVPYKKRSPLKIFMGAAACLAVAAVSVGVLRYFIGSSFFSPFISGSEDVPISASSVSSVDSDTNDPGYYEPDYVRGWDPRSVDFNPTPAIGSTAAVSTVQSDGITVSLVLHHITKLPGEAYSENGFDYTDYWGAKDIILYAEDEYGRKVAEDAVTPHGGDAKFLHKDSIFDSSTRILYKTDSAEYIIMQFFDRDAKTDALLAEFLRLDMKLQDASFDEYGISDVGFTAYSVNGVKRIGSWRYGYQASEKFGYNNESKTFCDPEYGYEVHFDNGSASVSYSKDSYMTGFDPDALEYNPYPGIGDTAVVSIGEADGATAKLIMYNVVKRPNEPSYLFREESDVWIAEDIYLYVSNNRGQRVLGELPSALYTDGYKLLPSQCLFEDCTRVYKTDTGRCLIMQYYDYDYDAENADYKAWFSEGSLERYAEDSQLRDENGISIGNMSSVEVVVAHSAGEQAAEYRVSKNFSYKAEDTFTDAEAGYDITFSFDDNTARAEPLADDPV